MDQQDLGGRTGGARAEQARVAHPRGVEDEQVARRDQRGELGEVGVDEHRALHGALVAGQHLGLAEGAADAARRPAVPPGATPIRRARLAAVGAEQHQQSAGRPLGQRLLGDELGREVVVEVGGAERVISRQRSSSASAGGVSPKRR